MKQLIFLTLLALSFSSCQIAKFTARPGVIVKNFPTDMYGQYQHIEKHNGVRDTTLVTINTEGVKFNDPIIGNMIDAQDSNFSLSHLGLYYYMNIKQTDSLNASLYYIYPFRYNSRYLYVYKLVLTKKSIKKMRKAGLKLSGRLNGEYTMENKAFKQYCEKYLRKRDAIKFIKLK
jgi:hypothetical protein